MRCSRCYDKLKMDLWKVKINRIEELYCPDCFRNEWGNYIENKVQVDGFVKVDNAKIKLKHYELNVSFKKIFVGD